MKPSVLGALLGALAGFCLILVQRIAVIQSSFVNALLFPGSVFISFANRTGKGDFGLMVFDFFAFFTNILVFAAVGWAIGRIFDGRNAA